MIFIVVVRISIATFSGCFSNHTLRERNLTRRHRMNQLHPRRGRPSANAAIIRNVRAVSMGILFGVLCLLFFSFGARRGSSEGEPQSPAATAIPPRAVRSRLEVSSAPFVFTSDSVATEQPSQHPRGAIPLTTVTFAMTEVFAEAWQKSSDRLTFSSIVKIDDDSGISHKSFGAATFYGKSSLKLKYTTRRSLEVHMDTPFPFSSESGETVANVSHFLLLSLWEDAYRLAYVSSIDLLKELGLFFSQSRLVELRCSASSDSFGAPDGGVWSGGPNRLQLSDLSPSQRVADLCGETLGVYLMVEYPSAAILRAVSGYSRRSPQNGPKAHGTLGVPATFFAGQRECEDPASYAARIRSLGDFEDVPLKHSPQAVISTRNWMYFEKPPIYDVLDVPSFSRNSSLSPVYRRIESSISDFTVASLRKDAGSQDVATYFDLSLYLSWVAINTLLNNGDYDDEVFFYGIARLGENAGHREAVAAARYFSIMAWDYDSVFGGCHRKGRNAAKSDVVFCGETPIEKLIAAQAKGLSRRKVATDRSVFPMAYDYFSSLSCVLDRVCTPSRWEEIVSRHSRHLEQLLSRPSVRAVTFGVEIERFAKGAKRGDISPSSPHFIAQGRADLIAMFGKSHAKLSATLGAYGFPLTAVAHADLSTAETADRAGATSKRSPAAHAASHAGRCPQVTFSADGGDAADTEAISARRIISREHKVSTASVTGWVRSLVDAARVQIAASGVTFWQPDGSRVQGDSISLPLSFHTAGLYCLSVATPPTNFGGECPHSQSRVLLPFVIRDKSRGKAEFATPSFEKPDLQALAGDSPGAPATQSIGLSTVSPPFWYGANTALSLPDDSAPQDVHVPIEGRRFPVVVAATADGSVVRRNSKLGVGSAAASTPESWLLRGRSAITVVATNLEQARVAPDLSREGPYVVHASNEPLPSDVLFAMLGDDVGSRPTATASVPKVIPPLGSGFWVDFAGFVRDSLNDSLKAANVRRFNRQQGEAYHGVDGRRRTLAPHDNGQSETATASDGEDEESRRLFLVVDGTVPVTISGRGVRVVIPAGAVIMMRSSAGKIMVSGGAALVLDGTRDLPITVIGAPSSSSDASDGRAPTPPLAWDTFQALGGGRIEMSWCFVSSSGIKGRLEHGTGKHHSHSSAVTVVGDGSVAVLTNVFFLYLYGPAVSSGLGGRVEVRDSIVQWAELGIECVMCNFVTERSLWALFPSWTAPYADNDNDAMYLSGGDHVVRDSVIAHTKDDGIDTGTPEKFSGGDGGSLTVTGTIIEMITHEAIALSSSPKGSRHVEVRSTLIQYAQQGVEVGYSGRGMEARISDSIIQHCAVGARYGDNYRIAIEGSASFNRVRFLNNTVSAMNYLRRGASVELSARNTKGGLDGEDRFTFTDCSSDGSGQLAEKSPCYDAVSVRF